MPPAQGLWVGRRPVGSWVLSLLPPDCNCGVSSAGAPAATSLSSAHRIPTQWASCCLWSSLVLWVGLVWKEPSEAAVKPRCVSCRHEDRSAQGQQGLPWFCSAYPQTRVLLSPQGLRVPGTCEHRHRSLGSFSSWPQGAFQARDACASSGVRKTPNSISCALSFHDPVSCDIALIARCPQRATLRALASTPALNEGGLTLAQLFSSGCTST